MNVVISVDGNIPVCQIMMTFAVAQQLIVYLRELLSHDRMLKNLSVFRAVTNFASLHHIYYNVVPNEGKAFKDRIIKYKGHRNNSRKGHETCLHQFLIK